MAWLDRLLSAVLVLSGCSQASAPARVRPSVPAPSASSGDQAATVALVRSTLKRAATFMVERVSYRGGYVWSYLGDFSRRWGEMEAYPTMIWVQPPGTPSIGQVLLDAHQVTGDDYFYEAAARAGEALVWGQHASGGWNYMIDFAGEESLRRWYATIGRNGWRLEEFQHYYGNATFDDGGTAESTRFLMRLYLERHDPRFRPAVDRALSFVLESQHSSGCFPQRYPMNKELLRDGQPEFPGYLTFNDSASAQNIDVLLMAYRALGDERVLEPVRRAMDCFLLLELPAPQSGWSLQYGPDLKPAAARTYEPIALSTKTSKQNVEELLNFYALTGEKKYLERVPAALDWLASLELPSSVSGGRANQYPELVAVGTNRPLYVHRRGSNVTNGAYYFDDDPHKTIVHSKQIRNYDLAPLRARYKELAALPVQRVTQSSPLVSTRSAHGKGALPRLFTGVDLPLSNMTPPPPDSVLSHDAAARLCRELNEQGYWPAKLERISNPYRGPGPREIAPGDFSETEVGDEYDTSPFRSDKAPIGISARTFIRNMNLLVRYLDARER